MTDIRIARTTTGYLARIRITGPDGAVVREVQDPSCHHLGDLVALIIALNAPYGPDPDADAPRLALALLSGVLIGPLPRAAWGGAASIAMEWAPLRVALRAGYQLPQTEHLEDDVLAARFRLSTAGLSVGWLGRFGIVELVPSAGIEVYGFTATRLGSQTPRTGSTSTFGPLLQLLFRLRLADHWGLSVAAEGVAAVYRPRFLFVDAGTLHRPAAVFLHAWLALDFRL